MSTDGFLLGHIVDPATGDRTGTDVDYDPSDLTTHGVIVGMTGSGKTGLGVILLEEALLSGLPALVIDPKGDMGNLELLFPDFNTADFEPWVSVDQARQDGISTAELGEKMAGLWRKGVSGWDPGLEAIRRLHDTVDVTIYTPGSRAGVPVNVVGSLAAPDLDWDLDAEAGRDEIEGFVSSLLTLAGLDADPLSSPEHILLANIIEHSWSESRDLDMAALIGQVQEPPMRKLGVFEVDTFFPPKDRMALAMRLNGLVASPSFASWSEGVPLDIQSMLFEEDGSPRAAIIYLAHLSEEERQFIVTMVLSKVVTWMRGLAGATELRALVYMDEVFGYAPPTANPPPKKPILTMLKQARAFGVGLVLSTQNPVDLDYKAMSNAGTWMIGRLQTERDKARILEALESAGGARDMKALDRMISGLDKRQFLLHNTRDSEPTVFSTRWAMSYLRGPLTREEVDRLTADSDRQVTDEPATDAPAAAEEPIADDETPVAPEVAARIPVHYLDVAAPWGKLVEADPTGTRLEPMIAVRVDLVYDEARADLRHAQTWEAIFHPLGDQFDAATAVVVDYDERDFRPEPPEGATYVLVDAPIDAASFWKSVKADVKDHLHRNASVEVLRNAGLKLYSRVGETEDEFQERCDRAAEDRADEQIAKLRDRLDTKLERAQDQLATAHRRMQELEIDADTRKRDEWMSGASDVLGVLLGGRRSRSLSGASRRRSQTQRTEQRLRTAQAKVQDKVDAIAELEQDLVLEVEEINDKWEDVAAEVDTIEVGLEKTDIKVDEVALVWVRK
ncbi:MAG: helicase HerA domain-containing protein [Acidimicrobiia bacterium]